jgi:hypothetical protein
MTSKWI